MAKAQREAQARVAAKAQALAAAVDARQGATVRPAKPAVRVIPLDVEGRSQADRDAEAKRVPMGRAPRVEDTTPRVEVGGVTLQTTPKLIRAAQRANDKQVSRTAVATAKAEPKRAVKAQESTMAKSTKKTPKAKGKAARSLHPCLCGCGHDVVGTFRQGHDARLHGMLLRGEVRNPSAAQLAFAKRHGVKVGAKRPKKGAK